MHMSGVIFYEALPATTKWTASEHLLLQSLTKTIGGQVVYEPKKRDAPLICEMELPTVSRGRRRIKG